MKNKWSLRLRYFFDNSMSKGTISLISWLSIFSALLVLTISSIVVAMDFTPVGENKASMSFVEVVWMSAMQALDPGGIEADTGNWPFVFAMLILTIGGIFIVSSLIGILTSGLEQRFEELRRGRSIAFEKNHTVILGGSDEVFGIIEELLIANENQRRSAICILTEKDKIEFEDQLRKRIKNKGRTKIICRNGNPLDFNDIEIVNPNTARSIIVLPPADIPDPDLYVIKSVLAIINNPNRRLEPYHIATIVHTRKSLEVIKMIRNGDKVQALFVGDLVARITAQTTLQPGLSRIYEELLSFNGNEIYFEEQAELVGKSFAEALLAFEDSILIGIRSGNGSIQLNPPKDTIIMSGDKLIVISLDDGNLHWNNFKNLSISESAIQRNGYKSSPKTVNILMFGWNRFAKVVINELFSYVAPGSKIMVASEQIDSQAFAACKSELNDIFRLSYLQGDTTDCHFLNQINIPAYQSMIILPYSDDLAPNEADARTLLTLINLRALSKSRGNGFSIVSEMLDVLNRKLATVTKADDIIIGDQLISKMLAQISENKELTTIYSELFNSDGAEIYLKPVQKYIKLGKPVNFYTITESVRQQNEIAIGYQLSAEAKDRDQFYGVKINPLKSQLVNYAPGDRIIVLAED